MELDDTVCYCFHITKRKVLNFIRVEKPRVPSQIANCGGAGTGCGWCVAYLKKYFAESAEAGERQAISAGDTPELEAGDYAEQRAGYIRAGKGKPPPGAIPLPPAE